MGRPHNAGPASLLERRRGEVGRPRPVAQVTKDGGPDYVPPAERIAPT
jgi:hypothetical protein